MCQAPREVVKKVSFLIIITTNHGGTIRIIMRKIIPQGQDKDWEEEGKEAQLSARSPTGCDYLLITTSPDLLLL